MRKTAAHFKVLAHEDRLRMLWLLLIHPELCVCDITGVLGITQSKASRHLRILAGAGLVRDRRQGLWVHYSLAPAADAAARAQMDLLRAILAEREDAIRLRAELAGWLARKETATSCS